MNGIFEKLYDMTAFSNIVAEPQFLVMWRANLCATFLGNLVYPTPASKMLHFP